MIKSVPFNRCVFFFFCSLAWLSLVACSGEQATQSPAATQAEASGAPENVSPANVLSAFFGLDNALPFRANALCLGASGQDGMPIVLSHTVNAETLDAGDFRIRTQSGAEYTPQCVTLRPAQDPGENRTVLMIGQFGDVPADPPVSVEVVADLLSDTEPVVNFRGAQSGVTPLESGPSLVFAEIVAPVEITTDTRGTQCPANVVQVVRVTWEGGVRLPNRDEPGEAERKLYRVTISREDGTSDDIAPFALADLGDGDNNHLLCLGTSDRVVAISFPGGHLVDPNGDLNPDTQVKVTGGAAR